MNRPRLAALLLTAACVGAPTAAAAGSLQVNPLSIEIRTDHRVGSISLHNEESTPVTIHGLCI